MKTLEEFKKWYEGTYGESNMIEYLADVYLENDYHYPLGIYGWVKVGGKELPIGDVGEVVYEVINGDDYDEDLFNECCEWLVEYTKQIDEGKVLKLVKERKILERVESLGRDFK